MSNSNSSACWKERSTAVFAVRDYDLSATLDSGQAFRWTMEGNAWSGVAGRHWVRLWQRANAIEAQAAEEISDWEWLEDYLQARVELGPILAGFPKDAPMQAAARACRGLRLLRQDPWECLASFILSSTKQIVQIRQIVSLVCARYGEAIPAGVAGGVEHAFPSAAVLSKVSEPELRDCKMGFRAPYLKGTAEKVAAGAIDLAALKSMPIEEARRQLMTLPGVGRKIADCVLLFGYGFQEAFPVDVWVMKALKQLYFPRRGVNMKKVQQFAESHFGANAGYAQQYLFHYMRVRGGEVD